MDLLNVQIVEDSFQYLADQHGIGIEVKDIYTFTKHGITDHYEFRAFEFYNLLKKCEVDNINEVTFYKSIKIDLRMPSMNINELYNVLENFKKAIAKFKSVESKIFFSSETIKSSRTSGFITILLSSKIGGVVNIPTFTEMIKSFNRNGGSLTNVIDEKGNKIRRGAVLNLFSNTGDMPINNKYIYEQILPKFISSEKGSNYINNGPKKPFLAIATIFNLTPQEERIIMDGFEVVDYIIDELDNMKYYLVKPKSIEIYE